MQNPINTISKINKILGRGYTPDGDFRPLTDEEFFQISWEMGANQLDSGYRNLFKGLAEWIKKELSPTTALEIGCGPGYLLHCLNQLDINTIGVDGNPYSMKFFISEHPEHAAKYILDKEFQKTYAMVDVMIAIECFEHIPDEGLHQLLKKISGNQKPKFIVFSSTPHRDPHEGWDIMWGHINLKTESQWIELFAQFGYAPVRDVIPPATPWSLLFQSKESARTAPYEPKAVNNLVRHIKRFANRLKSRSGFDSI